MRNIKGILGLIIFIPSTHLKADEKTTYYTVKKGDVLTRIARKHFGKPTYSNSGAYAQLLLLNPELQSPDKILVGQRIVVRKEGEHLEVRPSERVVATEEDPKKMPSDQDSTSEAAVSVGADFFRMDATDRSTGAPLKILSGASPSISAEWKLHYTPDIEFFIKGSFQKYQLQTLDNNISYLSSSGTRTGFSIGGTKKISESFSLGAHYSAQESLFARLKTPTLLSVDKAAVSAMGLHSKLTLTHTQNSELGVFGSYSYLATTSTQNYRVKSGSAYSLAPYMQYKLKNSGNKLEARVSYEKELQDSSIMKRDFSVVSFQLKYLWEF